MSRFKPRRPSPAMVVAMIALGIALNGTAIGGKKDQANLRANSITSKHLKKGAVKASDIANGAVTSRALAADAVTSSNLAKDAVTSRSLAFAAVTSSSMAANSVGSSALAAGSVQSTDLGFGSVTQSALAPSSVTEQALKQGSVNAWSIALQSITGQQLAPHTISNAQLTDGAIGPPQMARTIPAVSATHTTSQTMPGLFAAGTLGTPIAFDSEAGRWDSQSMHDTGTQNSRLTASQAGVYSIEAKVVWAADPDGYRLLTLFKNGSAIVAQSNAPPARDANGAAVETPQTLLTTVKLAAGDYVEIRGMQVSAPCPDQCVSQNLNIQPGPTFTMTWELHG